MAEARNPEADDPAEKAYAAAAEAVTARPEPTAVQFPSKAKRGRKPRVMAVPELSEDEAAVSSLPKPAVELAPEPMETKPTAADLSPAKPSRPPRKPAKPARAASAKKLAGRVRAPIAPAGKSSIISKTPRTPQLKDKIMATQSTDFGNGFKSVISDVQGKAKAVFEKSTSAIGEYTDFAKGNVEAAVESGKIVAAGLQEIGTGYVADTKAAFETMTADVKELAAAKTPVDFFRLQGDLARRNFDTAVAFGSKNSEAMLKLVNDAFAPLSNRVSVAVEKIKQTA